MRIEGWEQRLSRVIAYHAAKPFVWGGRDCATLFSQAVAALTGENPADGLPPWFSAASALASVRAAGFETMQQLVLARFAIIHPSQATRGDVGYFGGHLDALACPSVIVGSEVVSMTLGGWAVSPLSSIVLAYKVG